MIGRLDEAQALFDRLLALRNDLGLFSEEYDQEHRRLIGNFPQAFTHLTLIASAMALSEDCRCARQCARTESVPRLSAAAVQYEIRHGAERAS